MDGSERTVDVGGELDRFLLENPEVRYIDAMFPDICGIVRGKRLTLRHAKQLFSGGLQMPGSMLLLSVTGSCMDPLGYGVSDGDPDIAIEPIPGSLRPVPWADRPRGQVQVTPVDESYSAFDPRHVLAAVLRRFDEMKLRPVVACELEFCLIDRELTEAGAPRAPVSPSSGRREGSTQLMSLSRVDDFGAFIEDVTSVCAAYPVPMTALNAEYGGDQFELNLHHVEDAVRAADDAVALKQIVQGVAARHGMRATFMAKPYAEKAGSGMHWHVSVLDADGQNIFDDARSDGDEMLSRAVAGVLGTLPEAMAFVAPNINSYKRFQPGLFVPMTRTWGWNNRSVAVRIPGGAASDRRLEYRLPGADANPYLALAVLLAGIHHGISRKLVPPPASSGNASLEPDPDVPLKLYDALATLRSAAILPGYIGQEYCEVYAATKRLEMEAFLSGLSGKEFSWYLRSDS